MRKGNSLGKRREENKCDSLFLIDRNVNISLALEMKILSLNLLFLIIINSALALPDAPESGVVSADSVWRLSNSPINVTSDVQVAPGVTLNIEAGVEVLFSQDTEILIMGGALNIEGIQGSPVCFRNANDQSSGTRGIIFKSADLSNSTINYLEIKGLTKAIQIGEETEHAQGQKNNNELLVQNFAMNGGMILTDGYSTGSSIRFENVDIKNAVIKGNYPRSEKIYITNGVIENTTINSDSYHDGMILDSLNISNSTFSLGCCGANIILRSSFVIDSNFSDYNNYYDVTIEDCELLRTAIELPQGYVTVEDSQLYESPINAGRLIMTDSNLISPGDTGVRIHNFNNTVSSVTGSQITNCDIGIEVMPQASIAISGSNIFNNHTYNLKNKSLNDITANGNYWGELNSQQIESLIFHQSNDLNLGMVDFSNASTTPFEGQTYPFRNNQIFSYSTIGTEGGNIVPSETIVFYTATSISISANPIEGYVFVNWEGNVPTNLKYQNPINLDVNNSISISAIFAQVNSDVDGDGVYDAEDAFPNDPNETEDSDSDGVGDNSDAFPYDYFESVDSDEDGLGDNSDTFPNIPTQDIVNDVLAKPQVYDLYSRESVKELSVNSTIVDVSNNQATVHLQMEESSDLESWTETGDTATMVVPADTDTKFFRFKMTE